MGPIVSWVKDTGTIPSRLIKPRGGRSPTRLVAEEGDRMEPPVSDPVPAAAKFAATAAPVPPEDPPGGLVRAYGFFTCPPSELTEIPPLADSCRLALPRISAPASRIRLTAKWSFSVFTPFIVWVSV